MPTPTTFYEPKYNVYKTYGMADKSPKAVTSPYNDVWPDTGTPPLNREQVPYRHETPPPSWEYMLVTNQRYNNKANMHGVLHGVYHTVKPHIDDAVLFRHRHPLLWHEVQMADKG
jgi:hypothetical protein